jgi:serine/threonine protein phosphatase 1
MTRSDDQTDGERQAKGRLFAIGDIHGCSTALGVLIREIAPRPDDTVIVLGDFVDYGPDTKSVVERLMELRGQCDLITLLGNHEEMLVTALDHPSEINYWLDCGGKPTLESYGYRPGGVLIPSDHARFIRGCRDYYETETHIFVHANYDHSLPMNRIARTKLRWESIVPTRLCAPFSGKQVIVGHTPQVNGEVLDLGFLVCLDTDCSRGGWLSALEVGTGRVIQTNQEGEVRFRQVSATLHRVRVL